MLRKKIKVKYETPVSIELSPSARFSFQIQDVVQRHPEGCSILGGNLKPLTLTKFLDVCDLLMKMLHPTISITKANYIKELPFLLQKRMYYKVALFVLS